MIVYRLLSDVVWKSGLGQTGLLSVGQFGPLPAGEPAENVGPVNGRVHPNPSLKVLDHAVHSTNKTKVLKVIIIIIFRSQPR